MKKIILILCLLFSLTSCNRSDKIIIIGHKIANISFNDKSWNYEFLLDKLESKTLLNFVENNSKSNQTNSNIKSLIKSSKTVFISVGLYDVMKNVSLYDGQLEFSNHESILEIYEMNLVSIIDEIRSINSRIKINLFSLYVPYINDASTFYENYYLALLNYNRVISEVCRENQLNYIDISFISSQIIKYNQVSIYGENQVLELVDEYE